MIDQRVFEWLQSRDTGISSEAIVTFMNGVTPNRIGGTHPHDPADLGRCIRMLEKFPEYRMRLHEMSEVSEVWAQLVANWDELETLYREELPLRNASKTYDRMHELILAGGALW